MEHQKACALAVTHVHAAHRRCSAFHFRQRGCFSAHHTLPDQPTVKIFGVRHAQRIAHVVLAAHLQRDRHASLGNVGLWKLVLQARPQSAVHP